ncbi:hypothetical protein BWI97_02330 [Siphonobacter sp. BAB-5405]|uniref:hypothetical protein n=1 Tax=Siphonobacter sp. BAB-5405 TaxID=1864825 RepID=UPI000C80C0AE|nr:hypothetical protein [Siphonobacter sp. BAB-5405]PMD99258.1 hypothetical protein BWI97_02330 [Siphonobacter sp. BAB-5405]
MPKKELVYQETQKMTQAWIWLPLLAIMAMWVAAMIHVVIGGNDLNGSTISTPALLALGSIPVSLLMLFYFISLKTVVVGDVLEIQFSPFVTERIRPNEVVRTELITYGFIGYGYRFSKQYGTVFNAKGSTGVLIYKNRGEKVLIGTQQPEALQQAIQKWRAGTD